MSIPRWKAFMHPAAPDRIWLGLANWGISADHLTNSTDGGRTWNLPKIYLPDDSYCDYHMSLAGDASGNIFTTFPVVNSIQFRRVAYPANSPADRDPLRTILMATNGPRSNVMVDPNTGRVWVFTRQTGAPAENVKYHFSDNGGATFSSGMADQTMATEVRIGSMPYIDGHPALVVLYINSSLGYKYYLWNGVAFEERPDAQIYAGNVGTQRAFAHNVIGGEFFHLLFGLDNQLHHYWKAYNNGTGAWNHQIVDQSTYTSGNDWETSCTVHGDDLYAFYSKKSSSPSASSKIYYSRWSQTDQTWSNPVLISTLVENTDNHWPNTSMQVPAGSDYIPVFWYSHRGNNSEEVYFNRIEIESDPTGPCCEGQVGDVNGAGGDEPTIGDITLLVDHLFVDNPPLPCYAEADCNGSGGPDPSAVDITIGDISALIDYLFMEGATLPACSAR
jgi:hypothetical protein